jgi:hypothetical protein
MGGRSWMVDGGWWVETHPVSRVHALSQSKGWRASHPSGGGDLGKPTPSRASLRSREPPLRWRGFPGRGTTSRQNPLPRRGTSRSAANGTGGGLAKGNRLATGGSVERTGGRMKARASARSQNSLACPSVFPCAAPPPCRQPVVFLAPSPGFGCNTPFCPKMPRAAGPRKRPSRPVRISCHAVDP